MPWYVRKGDISTSREYHQGKEQRVIGLDLSQIRIHGEHSGVTPDLGRIDRMVKSSILQDRHMKSLAIPIVKVSVNMRAFGIQHITCNWQHKFPITIRRWCVHHGGGEFKHRQQSNCTTSRNIAASKRCLLLPLSWRYHMRSNSSIIPFGRCVSWPSTLQRYQKH